MSALAKYCEQPRTTSVVSVDEDSGSGDEDEDEDVEADDAMIMVGSGFQKQNLSNLLTTCNGVGEISAVCMAWKLVRMWMWQQLKRTHSLWMKK